jgi:surfactin synthase thioesterase subunit
MGGLLAFETVRALRKDHLKTPFRVFISSTPQLTTYSAPDIDPAQTDEALIKVFPHLERQLVPDEDLHQLLLNLLRADLLLIRNYQYVAQVPLDIPLTILFGESDPRVSEEQAEKWKDETFSSCTVIRRPGGHRYIEQDAEAVVSLIREETVLAGVVTYA